MTLILPVLVAVFGILSVYGRQGWLASLWQMLGLQWTFSPTACRAFYWRTSFLTCQWRAVCCCNLWKAFPASSASSPPSSVCAAGIFRFVEWPWLRRQIPPVAALIFMLCFASFATVLSLGGGPQATTIELAIFQALSYDYDPPARRCWH